MAAGFQWTGERVDCNLCGVDRAVPVFHDDVHGLGLHLVVCAGCGLLYFNPRPTAADYDRFYTHDYHRMYASRLVYNRGQLGNQITTATARTRMKWYAPYLVDGKRLLEIGPGEGAFLLELGRRFPQCEALGIEPSPAEVESCRARGAPVIQGYVEQLEPAPSFTHVAAFHVLEHALDPLGLLRQLTQRLLPGGIFIAEVPNALGSWRGLGMIHVAHPYLFSPETLSYAFRKAGLEVLEVRAEEAPLFESSVRLVARKAETPAATPPAVDVEAVQAFFRERLAGWQKQRFKFKVKQWAFQALGPSLGLMLWEHSMGRKWRAKLAEVET